MTTADALGILGVPPGASPSAVRRAYVGLAKAWHPDRVQDSGRRAYALEKMKRINAAYQFLREHGTRWTAPPPPRPEPQRTWTPPPRWEAPGSGGRRRPWAFLWVVFTLRQLARGVSTMFESREASMTPPAPTFVHEYAAPGTIDIGSTRGQVFAIHGPPTEKTDDVWSYGASKVYFSGQRVRGWDDSKASPLRVRHE